MTVEPQTQQCARAPESRSAAHQHDDGDDDLVSLKRLIEHHRTIARLALECAHNLGQAAARRLLLRCLSDIESGQAERDLRRAEPRHRAVYAAANEPSSQLTLWPDEGRIDFADAGSCEPCDFAALGGCGRCAACEEGAAAIAEAMRVRVHQ